jgi:hypothetical protein
MIAGWCADEVQEGWIRNRHPVSGHDWLLQVRRVPAAFRCDRLPWGAAKTQDQLPLSLQQGSKSLSHKHLQKCNDSYWVRQHGNVLKRVQHLLLLWVSCWCVRHAFLTINLLVYFSILLLSGLRPLTRDLQASLSWAFLSS